MKTNGIFLGLVSLLWSFSAITAQNICEVPPCEPVCETAPCDPCNPCDPCGISVKNSNLFGLTVGGWVEAGIYTNSISSPTNGPMHSAGKERRDFNMTQLYFFAEKELDTEHGFDWGARIDLVYGTDTGSMQSFEDQSFDYDWGNNRHGYGMSAYQLYGTLGYKDLSVKYGKFITPVGWEESAAKNNFFYSHSYCYWIEPATHTGVLGTYKISDNLTFNAGWTAGMDNGFANKFDDSSILTGFTVALSEKATVYYWINKGTQYNGWSHYDNDWRWGDEVDRKNEYFVQSICLEYLPTDKFTYLMQYNLRNNNYVAAADGAKTRGSAYGINNHFLYKLSDQWKAGVRAEWLRDSSGGLISGGSGDYYEVTLGLNWNPVENVSIRPEIRYDWCNGNNDQKPFGLDPVTELPFAREQVSGGCGIFVSF